MAAFNGRPWLNEQIDSILVQSDVDVTLFISVDRSTDGTEELVDNRANADSRIRLLTHGEHFGGAAKNFFRLLRELDFTGFDYVGFADQDDVWFSDKLATAAAVLRQTRFNSYSSDVIAVWPSGEKRLIRKSPASEGGRFLLFEDGRAGLHLRHDIEAGQRNPNAREDRVGGRAERSVTRLAFLCVGPGARLSMGHRKSCWSTLPSTFVKSDWRKFRSKGVQISGQGSFERVGFLPVISDRDFGGAGRAPNSHTGIVPGVEVL